MSEILVELGKLTQASQEQTAASHALSQEVAGKIGEINNELEAKKTEVDVYLANQAIKLIKNPSEFLLLGEMKVGESVQFHGSFGLDNYTGAYWCVLSLVKNYTTNAIVGKQLNTYGSLGFSVCTVTLSGVQYLALRNDGEANRNWTFVGHIRSRMDFLGVESVDSVDEVHTLTSLVA
ncbi:TPA: hypothetical protein RSW61_005305 [Vibrio harveyi]|nr:hypothetical protein [Vibrio harveyi]